MPSDLSGRRPTIRWIDLCPACGGWDDVHCWRPECVGQVTVGCHRGHADDPWAAMMLPHSLGVRHYGFRN